MKIVALLFRIFLMVALAIFALLGLALCILAAYAEQFDASAVGFMVFIVSSVVAYLFVKVEAR